MSQYQWDKFKRLILELVDMEAIEEEVLDRSKMESMRGLLLYTVRTYQYMNPYLKGLHLTLNSWRSFIEREGWRVQVEKINLAEMDGKWENVEEGEKPLRVKCVMRLNKYLDRIQDSL